MPEALNHPLTELISDAKAIPEKLLLEPLDEDFLILKFTIKKTDTTVNQIRNQVKFPLCCKFHGTFKVIRRVSFIHNIKS